MRLEILATMIPILYKGGGTSGIYIIKNTMVVGVGMATGKKIKKKRFRGKKNGGNLRGVVRLHSPWKKITLKRGEGGGDETG